MKHLRTFLIALFAMLLPAVTFGADSNISSLLVTQGSSTAGGSSSYTFRVALDSNHNIGFDTDTVTFFFATEDATTPDDSGFSFENASLGAYDGATVESSEVTQANEAFSATIDTSFFLNQWNIGVAGVANSSTDGCYKVMVTSEDPGPSANYTSSDVFSIGDATCGDEDTVSAPERPTKSMLSVRKIRKRTATLKVTPVDDATYYKFQLRKRNGTKIKTWTNVSTNKKAVKKRFMHAGTKYKFRVKACNSGGCSSFSPYKKFRTNS